MMIAVKQMIRVPEDDKNTSERGREMGPVKPATEMSATLHQRVTCFLSSFSLSSYKK